MKALGGIVRIVGNILLSTVVICGSTASYGQDRAAKVYRKVADSVVSIEWRSLSGEARTGSGVVIRSVAGESVVVTNAHVVPSGSIAFVVYPDGKMNSGFVLPRFPRVDLAFIQVSATLKPASIRTTPVEIGSDVFAIGQPMGLTASISNGIVSAIRRGPGGVSLVQFTAPISPGSSGGGLFDANGSLVGITTSFVEGGQNLNFAVDGRVLAGFALASVSVKNLRSAAAEGLLEVSAATLRSLQSEMFSAWVALEVASEPPLAEVIAAGAALIDVPSKARSGEGAALLIKVLNSLLRKWERSDEFALVKAADVATQPKGR
ncbi:MAG: serine protease [Betaproteobacteria bacterium]|jgi:S1-C subfamily serine protease|nr:serine protease [Betaproteobacteria bacterium]